MKENIYYIYKHTRIDTNEVFYVGKGCRNRAYTRNGRNPYWKHITAKSEYIIDIIESGLSEEEAFSKEKELIILYKKQGLCKANLIEGGTLPIDFPKEFSKISTIADQLWWRKYIDTTFMSKSNPNIKTATRIPIKCPKCEKCYIVRADQLKSYIKSNGHYQCISCKKSNIKIAKKKQRVRIDQQRLLNKLEEQLKTQKWCNFLDPFFVKELKAPMKAKNRVTVVCPICDVVSVVYVSNLQARVAKYGEYKCRSCAGKDGYIKSKK